MDNELKEYLKNLKKYGKIITSNEYRDKYGEVNQEVRARAINADYIEYGSSGPDTIEITSLGLEQLGISVWFKHNFHILSILLMFIAIIVTIVNFFIINPSNACGFLIRRSLTNCNCIS
jgi:hypothetical protein